MEISLCLENNECSICGTYDWTYHICKCTRPAVYSHFLALKFLHFFTVSLFHMVTRYYCIFLSLPCRANYYRKLYSKYITTGHQFFCASQGWNTHSTGFPPFPVASPYLWKPVPFSYNSSFISSLPAFRRQHLLETPTGSEERIFRVLFIYFYIYLAFLPVYWRNYIWSPFVELRWIIGIKARAWSMNKQQWQEKTEF